jgi:phospholipase C
MSTLLDVIGNIEHVVILMQENRSFDEYFGTFPGANGFANMSATQAAAAWQRSPALLPFRLSSFTWPMSGFGCDHSWTGQHASWANGALTGWSQASSGNPSSCLGYFLQNDIPYHWWLAQNFVLCDNYFCSILGPTVPNRLYMMTGTAIDPTTSPTSGEWPQGYKYPLFGESVPADNYAQPPNRGDPPNTVIGGWIEPTWNTYADYLTEAEAGGPPLWKLYDLATDGSPSDAPNAALPWDLNVLTWFNNTWNTMFPSGFGTPSAHYGVGLSQFTADVKSGALPKVSWIIPPYGYTEHPDYNSWDGAALVSTVVNALLGTDEVWSSTVLILTYDENDGHYDHVPPLIPGYQTGSQPTVNADEFTQDANGVYQPTGSGFRVPTTVISPWTYQGGVCSLQFDHTSIIKFLEEVTQIPCASAVDNLTPWRRDNNNFSSLSAISCNAQGAAASVVQSSWPPAPNAGVVSPNNVQGTIQAWATLRQKALQGITLPYPQAQQQTWPPVPQGCQIIMNQPSYGLGEVNAQPNQTFAGAIVLTVNGFEPNELINPNSVGANPSGGLPTQFPSNTGPCQRGVILPSIAIYYPDGTQVDNSVISCVASRIDVDPSTVPLPSGFPFPFTFYCDLKFLNPTAAFSAFPTGTAGVFTVAASFQVDATVTSLAEMELVTTDDPQFYRNFYDNISWLSGELVVFSLASGGSMFGATLGDVAHPTAATGADAITFIQNVISNLNSDSTWEPSFDALNQDEEANPLSLFATPPNTIPIFNFALARVHMQAQQTETVRVFFRSFRASVTSSAYEPVSNLTDPSTYRSNPPPLQNPGSIDTRIPLLGVVQPIGQSNLEYVTIPFFATPRNPGSITPLTADSPNVIPIPASPAAPNKTYFGCWLDINQTTNLFPSAPPVDPTQWDGPWTPGTLQPILQAFKFDLHQCLVAEISFDGIEIPAGDTPGASAWLAQRNLAFMTS